MSLGILPGEVIQHVLTFLPRPELCRIAPTSQELREIARHVTDKFAKFYPGAILNYTRTRVGRRVFYDAVGTITITKVMPKMIEVEHLDRNGVGRHFRKKMRLNEAGGVRSFQLGDVGARYGGSFMRFYSDDMGWVMPA